MIFSVLPRSVSARRDRAPGQQALARATLGYCGIRSAHVERFGPVIAAPDGQRQRWLNRARRTGSRLAQGALSASQRRSQSLGAWFTALRLQFYPMTWVAYTLGAVVAAAGASLAMTPYLLGYAALFMLEAATVFLNEWFDFDSDRRNRHGGPFTGGSRVLAGSTALRCARASAFRAWAPRRHWSAS